MLFYAPDITLTRELPPDESHHAVKVLRLVEGDALDVIDGSGKVYRCRIVTAHAKHCAVTIDNETEQPRSWHGHITVALAPTKLMDRMEWAVEKMVELGVDRIVPLLTEHCERRTVKLERLERIVVAAMKQSLKAVKPVLSPPAPIAAFLGENTSGRRLIAYCDPSLPREQRQVLPAAIATGEDTTIMIGPEGDFSPTEVAAALAAGYMPVTLGDSRLRAETAAVTAVAMVHTVEMMR